MMGGHDVLVRSPGVFGSGENRGIEPAMFNAGSPRSICLGPQMPDLI